jgi:TATA-binding protein-associated factor
VAKFQALRQLLSECGLGAEAGEEDSEENHRHRVLLFAQSKEMLNLVESDLLRAYFPHLSFRRLDGDTPSVQRHAVVTNFNEDPTIDILLLTTAVGGLGLNLTGWYA